MTKRCCKCKQEKPVDCFQRNKSTRDGFNDTCRACYQKRDKALKGFKRL